MRSSSFSPRCDASGVTPPRHAQDRAPRGGAPSAPRARRRLGARGRAWAAWLLLGLPAAAHADDAAPAAESAPPTPSEAPAEVQIDGARNLAVVVRGGAALGSFEAGTLHAMTELDRIAGHRLKPSVVTGTSAGSINGVIVALASGSVSPQSARPEDSLYFRAWTPVGTGGMFDEARVSARGAFTRSGVMSQVVRDVLEYAGRGMAEGSEVLLGIPVTRLEPREMPIDRQQRLKMQQAGEMFVVRLRGRGPGKRPQITNAYDPRSRRPQAALRTDAQGEVSMEQLVDVVLASSAIPPAFAPVEIAHCTDPIAASDHSLCPASKARTEPFVDGGFIDNMPLRLAMRMTHMTSTRPAQAKYLLIDPSEMMFAPPPKRTSESSSLLGLGESLAGGLAGDAQSVALREALREDDSVESHVSVLQSDWPLASSPLQAFFGFFEQEFRFFDFAMGMHEAQRLVREDPERVTAQLLPQDVARNGSPMQRRLACLHEVLDRDGPAPSCAGDDLANFRAVLQSSVDRLAARCSQISQAQRDALRPTRRAEALCAAVYDGGEPPRVPGVRGDRHWRMHKAEQKNEMAYVVRRLTAAGFEFRDLGLRKASAERVRVELTTRISRMARAFAAAQPNNSLLLRSAARTFTQQLQYVPPTHSLHVLSGPSLEIGYSATRAVSPYRHFRLAGALLIDGVPSLLTGDTQSYLALTPQLGLEVEPPWFSSAMLQTRFLVRGGFQFSSGDGFLTHVSSPTAGAPISRPVIDAAIAVSALQWVRVQLGLAVFPSYRHSATQFALRPGLGVQFDLPL